MRAAALEIVGLTAGYGSTSVLDNISLKLAAGQRLAVLGRNGVGKTTLLASVVGLTQRHGGRIRLADEDVTTLAVPIRARRGLGYVPQTRDVFRSLTVAENLLVGLKDRPAHSIDEAYALFPRLAERRGHMATQLSGGEQQMLSIARTMLGQPRLLLLDEPLEGLAPVICDEVMAALDRLAAGGDMTIVLVEQQVQRALAFANRIVMLDRGRVVWSGSGLELSQQDDVVERFVGVGRLH